MKVISRKRLLIATGIATVAFNALLLLLDRKMQDAGGPSILGFEFAGSETRAAEVMAEWGESGRDYARGSLWIDFGFMLSYGAFFTLAALATRDFGRENGLRRLAAVGVLAPTAATAAAVFDAAENVFLLLVLGGHGDGFGPPLATVCASVKFGLIAFAIFYVLWGLVSRLRVGSVPASNDGIDVEMAAHYQTNRSASGDYDSSVSVRRMRPDELAAAVSVWREANAARDAPHGLERTARIREKLSAPDALPFVAERSSVVGMALAEPGRFDDGAGGLDPSLLHISMVFVRPDAQRTGVGLSLLLHTLEVARSLGYEHVDVWTAQENRPARGLYERAGMSLTGKSAPLREGVQLQYGCFLSGADA